MDVFVLSYDADFGNEKFHEVQLYDSYSKAKESFIKIAKGWFNKEHFNTKIPTSSKVWADGVYDGYYSNYIEFDKLYIEEDNNMSNYLSLYIKKQEVM